MRTVHAVILMQVFLQVIILPRNGPFLLNFYTRKTTRAPLQNCSRALRLVLATLFEFSQCFGYALHCLADIVFAGGVAHAEISRCTKSIAADSCHMCFF